MIGLKLGLWRAAKGIGGGVAPFTPASLFAGGYSGDWWDVADTNTVYSDAAGTTLITRGADTTVGSWKGKVNNTLIAAGAAGTFPLYKTANDTLLFDGVDDFLISSGNVMTPYPVSIVAIVDKTLSANGAYGAGAVAASNTDHVSIKATSSAGGTGFNDRAAAGSQFSNLISMPAYTGGLSALFLYAATTAGARLLYSEGTEASIAAAVENTHAASRIVMGATRQAAGTPSSFGGARLRASIVINKVLSATERNNLRTYYSIA